MAVAVHSVRGRKIAALKFLFSEGLWSSRDPHFWMGSEISDFSRARSVVGWHVARVRLERYKLPKH